MADLKISQLTGASTPLAGTEVLPIVQSGSTVKVSVANLTAGRAVSAASVTASTGNFVVGTSGQGIDFSATPGTGTSELLNDYEEGTWTPTITGGATSITYVTQLGLYTKVGRVVNFSLYLITSAASAVAANFTIGGLPFTAGSFGIGSFAYDTGAFVNSSTINMPMILVGNSSTQMSFFQGNGTQVQGTDINAIGNLSFGIVGSYIV